MAYNATKDEVVTVRYRTPRGFDTTSKTLKMDVFDHLDAADAPQSAAMSQVGSGNKYKADFTPSDNGQWTVVCYWEHDTTGAIELEKQLVFNVGNFNVNTVGAIVSTNEAKLDAVGVLTTAMDVKIDSLHTKVDNLDVGEAPDVG